MFKRGAIYYCRVLVPKDVQIYFQNRKELWKSTGSKLKRTATMQAKIYECKALLVFGVLRTMLTELDKERIATGLIAEFSGTLDEHRRSYQGPVDFYLNRSIPRALPEGATGGVETIDHVFGEGSREAAAQHIQQLITELLKAKSRVQYTDVTLDLAEQEAAARNIPMPALWELKGLLPGVEVSPALVGPGWKQKSQKQHFAQYPEFGELCRTIAQAQIDAYSVELERLQGYEDTDLQRRISLRIENAKPCMRLSDLWTSFSRAKIAGSKWVLSSQNNYTAAYNRLLGIFGDKELRELEQPDSASLLLESVRQLKKDDGRPCSDSLKRFTVSTMAEMFNYALSAKRTWGIVDNPFKGTVPDKNPNPENERDPYNTDDLQKLIAALPGVDRFNYPGRFWLPLLCLFTGARATEVLQLRVDDISNDGNRAIIRFTTDAERGQRTKSKKERYCVVHPVIQRIGFLNYVSVRKSKAGSTELLFKDVKLVPSDDKYGKAQRNWYNTLFEPKFITDDPKKTLHSLRHTFISTLVGSDGLILSELLVLKSIIGHALDGPENKLFTDEMKVAFDTEDLTTGRYGKDGKVSTTSMTERQVKLLGKLKAYGVDWSPLYGLY